MPNDKNIDKSTTKPKRSTAIAIKNDLANRQELPKITAIGHGALAEKILQIAFESGVKVRKDEDLTAILSTLELDHEIPPEAIIAVAEILYRVYVANNKLAEVQKAYGIESTHNDTKKD